VQHSQEAGGAFAAVPVRSRGLKVDVVVWQAVATALAMVAVVAAATEATAVAMWVDLGGSGVEKRGEWEAGRERGVVEAVAEGGCHWPLPMHPHKSRMSGIHNSCSVLSKACTRIRRTRTSVGWPSIAWKDGSWEAHGTAHSCGKPSFCNTRASSCDHRCNGDHTCRVTLAEVQQVAWVAPPAMESSTAVVVLTAMVAVENGRSRKSQPDHGKQVQRAMRR
jgi:hypothetical protein